MNIPKSYEYSNNFRLRIVSSSPVVVSNESAAFAYLPKFNVDSDIKTNKYCVNTSSRIEANMYPNLKYKWNIPNAKYISGRDSNKVDFEFTKTGINDVQLILFHTITKCYDTLEFAVNVNQPLTFDVIDITPNNFKIDTICVNQVGIYLADSLPNFKYYWMPSNGAAKSFSRNKCEIYWFQSGLQQIYIFAIDETNGFCAKPVTKYIFVEELPAGNITGLNKTCIDCEHTYKFQSTNSNNSNKLKYDWIIDSTIAEILIIIKDEITIKPKKEGNTQIKLNVLDSNTNCINSFAFNLSISQEVPLTISGNEDICENIEYTYYTIDRDYYDFTWKIDGNYDLINSTKSSRTIIWIGEQNGKITLTRKDNNLNKIDTLEKYLYVNSIPEFKINHYLFSCVNYNYWYGVDLSSATYNINYVLSPLENQKDFLNRFEKNGKELLININKPGKYLVTVNVDNKRSCSGSITDTITILPLPDKPNITNLNNKLICNSTAIKYYWYRDNILIKDNNSSEYTANEDGTYHVITENEFGCKSEKSDEIIVKITSVDNDSQLENEYNIKEITENFILINTENITNTESFTIQLSDVLGRILPISTIYENGKIQIKLIENNIFIANNQYFLNIKGNNTNTTLKFRVD